MPRLPRIDVAGIAQHIVQRGNNRLPCFLAEGDYIRYRDDLRDTSALWGEGADAPLRLDRAF